MLSRNVCAEDVIEANAFEPVSNVNCHFSTIMMIFMHQFEDIWHNIMHSYVYNVPKSVYIMAQMFCFLVFCQTQVSESQVDFLHFEDTHAVSLQTQIGRNWLVGESLNIVNGSPFNGFLCLRCDMCTESVALLKKKSKLAIFLVLKKAIWKKPEGSWFLMSIGCNW